MLVKKYPRTNYEKSSKKQLIKYVVHENFNGKLGTNDAVRAEEARKIRWRH